MRVVTLDSTAFRRACRELEEKAAGFCPDLVISIATGGVYVGELIFKDVRHVSVFRQRPSTARKNGLLSRLIALLPTAINDWLRIAEARILSLKKPVRAVPLELSPEVRQAVIDSSSILVVDDAVDSGATLEAVIGGILAVGGERDIRTAVITVTTVWPLIQPDYSLYNDRTLIRFPWSKDVKR